MTIEHFREESGRILATLIRHLGDFDLAEEAGQEAFAAALAQWPAKVRGLQVTLSPTNRATAA